MAKGNEYIVEDYITNFLSNSFPEGLAESISAVYLLYSNNSLHMAKGNDRKKEKKKPKKVK